MNTTQARRWRENREARWDAGSGAGSRGGVVIGTTSGGKPIYKSHGHPSHDKFTAGDHREAVEVHKAEIRKLKALARSASKLQAVSSSFASSKTRAGIEADIDQHDTSAGHHRIQAKARNKAEATKS